MNMRTITILSLAIALTAACLSPFQADARRPKKPVEILDGSQVYIGQQDTCKKAELRLAERSPYGLGDFRPDKTVFLYPKGQHIDQGIVEGGVAVTRGPLAASPLEGPEVAGANGLLLNVTDSARIDLYLPAQCNGQLVICCPGGGYGGLSTWNEGAYMAKWLADRNIACAVLKYRMPGGRWEIPLQDVQNALRYCRFHAAEWGVGQIGVAGFSAGGHLASCAATMFADAVTRPDFAILFYPVTTLDRPRSTRNNLLGKESDWNEREGYTFQQWYWRQHQFDELVQMYSTQHDVTASTPPTFITASTDDNGVEIRHTTDYYRALVACGVNAELHVYPYGGHGWGFTEPGIGLPEGTYQDRLRACRPECDEELERWLAQRREDKDFLAGMERAARFPFCAPRQTVLLYPEGQDVDKGIDGITRGPGESNGLTGPETLNEHGHVGNTGDNARFDIYLADKPTGKMVIVLPGGAYAFTSARHEGEYVAHWLCSQGVSAAVLKYRLPNGHWNVPLTDVHNTLRYCRAHAAEWGVEQIGVLGFSAGGHLAATASTLYEDAPTRPDFAILVYPVISCEKGIGSDWCTANLIGASDKWLDRSGAQAAGTESSFTAWRVSKDRYQGLLERYTLDRQVSTDTPPTFLVYCTDDAAVPAENELRYYEALKDCGVRCEIHGFPSGGHGWGFQTWQHGEDAIGPYRKAFFDGMVRFMNEL